MTTKTPPKKSLIGQFFHSVVLEDEIGWQGCVIGNPEPGYYYVQLFEWVMGEPNVRRLVRIEEMARWLFYESADAMKFSWEHGVAREGGPYRKKDPA